MNIDKIKKDFEEEFCYLDETNDESGHYETIDLIDTNPVELWNFIESALKEQESQIKQSILKAIMESEEPRLYDEKSDSYSDSCYIKLSVIKEILK